MTLRSIGLLAFFIAASLSAGLLGFFFTADSVDAWYRTLVQPSWTPPTWVFGPVWNTLYVLMGIAAWLVAKSKKPGSTKAVIFFLLHLLVNASWSIAFFKLHEIALSVAIILMIWLLIIALITVFARHSKTAAWLLVPYLLWVSYASTVNIGVLVLN